MAFRVDPSSSIPEAWANWTGSSDIVIANIDSGVDYNHPDLAATGKKVEPSLAALALDQNAREHARLHRAVLHRLRMLAPRLALGVRSLRLQRNLAFGEQRRLARGIVLGRAGRERAVRGHERPELRQRRTSLANLT